MRAERHCLASRSAKCAAYISGFLLDRASVSPLLGGFEKVLRELEWSIAPILAFYSRSTLNWNKIQTTAVKPVNDARKEMFLWEWQSEAVRARSNQKLT